MAEELHASIVIDYQNVHLTGHGLFASTRSLPRHETVIDPLLFARKLLLTRNSRQRPGMAHAVLGRVLVYRGEPSSEHDARGYARNQAQKSCARWPRSEKLRTRRQTW
ncbi:MAG: hypothetical protein ACYDDU_10255 [Dermatophilaceae bacterium]